MPLVQTRGAASAQGFGEFAVAATPTYIEDVFSCFLYTGTGSSQTITNNIDLSTKGGLVWQKARSTSSNHSLVDTVRGGSSSLVSDTTGAAATGTPWLTFNSNGFTSNGTFQNSNPETYASWTFRKQPKFFDVVTYTGSGSGTQTIAHNLGSVPGSIIVKLVSGSDTSGVAGWGVYHRSTGASQVLELNTTAAAAADNWFNTTPTASNFYVNGNDPHTNRSGGTYVAYLFAHDAGGFGLTGSDNVISCGSFTTSSYYATVNLGYEPQWILYKRTDSTVDGDWQIADNMRGLLATANSPFQGLQPNLSAAESSTGNIQLTSTGFVFGGASASPYIYIAIRRGPMKVPTDGTSVFTPVARTGTTSTTTITSGFPIDLSLIKQTNATDEHWNWSDRLRGKQNWLTSSLDNPLSPAEDTTSNTDSVTGFDSNTALLVGSNGMVNSSARTYANYFFKRAPSFFDSVCYTGTGSNQNITHNLGVAPELIIVKGRSNAQRWAIYSALLYGATKAIFLNTTENVSTSTVYWNNTAPTSSVFRVGTSNYVNGSALNYIAWLFATCAGVSKVGTYTGTGTTLQIDCGFTSGARFVLIKAGGIASYVWNSASGIVSGNDPYLLMNTNAAEVTNTDYIDTYSAGFELTSTASTTVNISSGQYIFLAIA